MTDGRGQPGRSLLWSGELVLLAELRARHVNDLLRVTAEVGHAADHGLKPRQVVAVNLPWAAKFLIARRRECCLRASHCVCQAAE